MRKRGRWKRLRSRLIYRNRWITLREDRVLQPDGVPGIYSVLETRGPCVYIVALTERNHVVLVRQHRYPTGMTGWELPGGNSEGKSLLKAAQRELQEETGFTATQWKRIGWFQTQPGISDELGYVYLARGLHPGQATNARAEGITAVKIVTLRQALAMVRAGKITDGQSVIALLHAALTLGAL